MTTNRTGKEGDDIFCTPMMIEHMNNSVIRNVSMYVKNGEIRVSKVVCAHKAPLSLGESFELSGELKEVKDDSATFHVLCTTLGDKPKVLGDGTVTIKVF